VGRRKVVIESPDLLTAFEEELEDGVQSSPPKVVLKRTRLGHVLSAITEGRFDADFKIFFKPPRWKPQPHSSTHSTRHTASYSAWRRRRNDIRPHPNPRHQRRLRQGLQRARALFFLHTHVSDMLRLGRCQLVRRRRPPVGPAARCQLTAVWSSPVRRSRTDSDSRTILFVGGLRIKRFAEYEVENQPHRLTRATLSARRCSKACSTDGVKRPLATAEAVPHSIVVF
jgi:hypothetical protein